MKQSDFLHNIFNFIYSKKNILPEICIFIIFILGVIFLTSCHEPWYDELHAIKLSHYPLKDILFTIPHIEGHTPFWHLILRFVGLFTNNPDLIIAIPNITFMSIAVWLLLFKSPFQRIIKLALPFTYFMFYQYSVIARPYSLFVLGIFITAILYKDKNIHPFKFISSLIFLSCISVYGMLFSTGVTLAWVIEIWNKQNILQFLKNFIKDKRFFAMLILFFVCLGISVAIFPSEENMARSAFSQLPLLMKLSYFIGGLPADATISNILTYETLEDSHLLNHNNIMGVVFGFYINIFFFIIFKQLKKLSVFLLTYLPFLLFSLIGYIWPHHIGILFFIILFYLWISNINQLKGTKLQLKIILSLTIIIQIHWSIIASINEIKLPYSNSKPVTAFINNNNLTKYNILTDWFEDIIYLDKTGNIKIVRSNDNFLEVITNINNYTKIYVSDLTKQSLSNLIAPYFTDKPFYNYVDFFGNNLYHYTNVPQLENNWKKLPPPDIIFCSKDFFYVVQESGTIEKIWGKQGQISSNYVLTKTFESGYIWKDGYLDTTDYLVLVRKDLYEIIKNYK